MTRAAAVALALAGGVYFAPPMAQASNMGFKLERSLDLVRNSNGGAALSKYWVSFPLFNGLGNVGNDEGTNKCCVGTAGCPDVTTADPQDALDAVCDMWQARNNPGQEGAFQFTYQDRDTCVPVSLTAAVVGGRVRFTGTVFNLQADVGYEAQIGGSATATPVNRAVIVGSHDPAFAGRTIRLGTGCGATAAHRDYLNLPYHTMYREADEILCGLINVDWVDADANGNPDTCFDTVANQPTGIFDGTRALQVEYFKNVPDQSGPVARTVTVAGGRLRFTGAALIDLVPGESYRVTLSPGHVPTTWISPHY